MNYLVNFGNSIFLDEILQYRNEALYHYFAFSFQKSIKQAHCAKS